MKPLDQAIADLKPELISIRKDLHRIPELGFQERKTAAYVAGYLRKLGLEVETDVAGTGVIALLRGKGHGSTLGLRACLDALAMDERSGVDYASEHDGAFHGCGHDGNMTFVLGAANILSQRKDQLEGNVKFIFQPSEEEIGGAAAIMKAGGLSDPKVDAIVHLHNWHDLKQGVLAVKPGPVMASIDTFKIEVVGKAGHGAWPHLAVDPIVIAATLVSALQTIVSREVDPLKPALITLGRISGGTAVNIIPESVVIEGTARAYHPEVRDFLQSRIEAIARGITEASRATCNLTYNRILPPVHNDPEFTAKVHQILSASFPPGMVVEDHAPGGMGGEDFSLYQQEIPGAFLFIGKDVEGCKAVPIHAPHYVFNDETLTTGVRALCEVALGFWT